MKIFDRKKKILLFFSVLLLTTNSVFADEVQEKCFETLKQNVSEIPRFETAYSRIKSLKYGTLEGSFSRYYKSTSSFGIDLDKPLFEMRLYSFGEQTGYIHPPFSPFSDYSQTEKWDSPAKEYIIAEEYITDTSGNRIFLGCSLMQISSDDLMKVTAENYLYDAEIISLLKTDSSLDYKAWYNENISFDYENNPFVTWYRLFIYPKETQNNYFSKYDVIDGFPANKASNFADLAKITGEKDTIKEVYVMDESGNIIGHEGTKGLAPVSKNGGNSVFPLYTFYQTIENTFPEFAEDLALRGEIYFDTVKKVISTTENMETLQNSDYVQIWDNYMNPIELTKYAKAKKDGNASEKYSSSEIKYYDNSLDEVGNLDNKIWAVILTEAINNGETVPEVNINVDSDINNDNTSNDNENNENEDDYDLKAAKETNTSTVLFVILGVLLVVIVGFVLTRKKG